MTEEGREKARRGEGKGQKRGRECQKRGGQGSKPVIPAGVPAVIPDIFYRESSIFVGSSVCNDPDSGFPLPQADQKRGEKATNSLPLPLRERAGVRGLCSPQKAPYHCHPSRTETVCAAACPGCSARSPSTLRSSNALMAQRLPSR